MKHHQAESQLNLFSSTPQVISPIGQSGKGHIHVLKKYVDRLNLDRF